ncbi:MAG: DUF6265 family protein [Acidobacteriia bacterium]|nr:DUF6265 family protein [Terriglobia bacterium]
MASLFLVAGAMAQPAACQQPSAAPAPATAKPAPTAPSVPAQKMTLADFAWLAGRWQGVWGPRLVQQVWMPARAGVMMGTFQLTENDKTLVLEVFTLVEKPDGVHFHLRHFTPSLAAWEKTDPAVLYLTSIDPKTAVFENPGEGQPRRTLWKRLDADTFVARSEVVRGPSATLVTEITYHRQKEARASRH